MKNEAERRCKDMKKGMKKLTAVAAISNRPTTTVNNESQFYRVILRNVDLRLVYLSIFN